MFGALKIWESSSISSASVSYLEAILCKRRGHTAFKAAPANSLLPGRFNSKFHCHWIQCVIMKGSVSIDETEHINKKLAEVPVDASLATIILMPVGEQCRYSLLKDSPQPHCIKDRLKHDAKSLQLELTVEHAWKQSPLHW